jgi:hypothetical protein
MITHADPGPTGITLITVGHDLNTFTLSGSAFKSSFKFSGWRTHRRCHSDSDVPAVTTRKVCDPLAFTGKFNLSVTAR